MKVELSGRILAFMMSFVLLAFAACSNRTEPSSTSEPSSQSESKTPDEPTAESTTAATEPETEATDPSTEPKEDVTEPSRESATPAITKESDDTTGYIPSELLGWQTDPDTLDTFWVIWEHLEYRLFGDTKDYMNVESEFVHVRSDGGLYGDNMPPLTVSYRLPSLCVTKENSIDIDLHFSKGSKLKIGEIPTVYYELQPGENPFQMPNGLFARNELIKSSSDEQPLVETVTQENINGGVWQTEKFLRGISGSGSGYSVTQNNPDGSVNEIIEFPANHTVQYYVLLDENTLGICFFSVSPQATAEDLLLYDAIVESMQIVSK